MIAEDGAEFVLPIQRVRCRSCNGSHCQLFDFFVPYRQAMFSALNSVVKRYITNPTTYLDAVEEAVAEPAEVFLAVERVLENLNEIWMFLMRILIAGGFTAEVRSAKTTCPNGFRSKKAGKQALLDWAAAMFEVAPNALEICNRYGLSIFAGDRGCKLKRTHSLECRLF